MTRQEYINICSVCTNRKFRPKDGIICGLTDQPADFELTCSDYNEDTNEVRLAKMTEKQIQKLSNKAVNRGRIALFIVAGMYLLAGTYEAFFMYGADIIFGAIDWGVSAIFIGLAILSYKKAFVAMVIGLAVYLGLVVLLAVFDPSTIIQGIIWKIIIVTFLVLGIQETYKKKDVQVNVSNDDLLDQL